MMAMMILAKSGVLTFAKSGILILFIFVVLLFDCKGTFFLTKPQFFRCFLDDDKQKMPLASQQEGTNTNFSRTFNPHCRYPSCNSLISNIRIF